MDPITMIAVANVAFNIIVKVVQMVQENNALTEEQKQAALAALEVKLAALVVEIGALGPVTPGEEPPMPAGIPTSGLFPRTPEHGGRD